MKGWRHDLRQEPACYGRAASIVVVLDARTGGRGSQLADLVQAPAVQGSVGDEPARVLGTGGDRGEWRLPLTGCGPGQLGPDPSMATTHAKIPPVPSCPSEPSPQQYATPPGVNPQVWPAPLRDRGQSIGHGHTERPVTGGEHAELALKLLPQQSACGGLSFEIAQVWLCAHRRSGNRGRQTRCRRLAIGPASLLINEAG
jgi:hypothetical protein